MSPIATDTRNDLIRKLNHLKYISTKEEWLVFTLHKYEDLSVNEISLIIQKPQRAIETTLQNVLIKAESVLTHSHSQTKVGELYDSYDV